MVRARYQHCETNPLSEMQPYYRCPVAISNTANPEDAWRQTRCFESNDAHVISGPPLSGDTNVSAGYMAFSDTSTILPSHRPIPQETLFERHGNDHPTSLPLNNSLSQQRVILQNHPQFENSSRSQENAYLGPAAVDNNCYQRPVSSQPVSQLPRLMIPELKFEGCQASPNPFHASPYASYTPSPTTGSPKISASSGLLQPNPGFPVYDYTSQSTSPSSGFPSPGSMGSWEAINVEECIDIGTPYIEVPEDTNFEIVVKDRQTRANTPMEHLAGPVSYTIVSQQELDIQGRTSTLSQGPKKDSISACSMDRRSLHYGRSASTTFRGQGVTKKQRQCSRVRDNEKMKIMRKEKACIPCQITHKQVCFIM